MRRRLCERGAVAVEFALVTPILIMLVVGTITTGISYSQALGITNAVREGARFGAIADSGNAAWWSDVRDRVRATQFDDPGLTTSICVEFWKNSAAVAGPATQDLTKSNCAVASGPGITAADLTRFPLPTTIPAGACVVRVVASRNYTISFPPFVSGLTNKMVRGSVARFEGASC